jgi:D-xylose 1-dehydrogenase (NADP+, D-xylono-1,5-lactone-forming)
MKKKLRVGLIGASQIVRNQHLAALRQAANVDLLGIASRRAEKADAWAKEFDIPRAYSSYDALLADPEIDAVLITLPMSLHAEWIVRAAQAGKHVLCEKPLVLNVAEADAVIAAARRNGVVVLEAFTHVYPPHLGAAEKLMADGVIGDVRAVRAEVLYPTADWVHDSRARKEYGACVLIEAGCYCVQTIRRLLRSEPVAFAGCASAREGCDFETTFAGVMKFPGGRIGYLCTTMESAFRAVCDIIGTRGRIELPDLFDGTRLRVETIGAPARELAFPSGNRFARQAEHFAACVLEGREPIITLEDSRNNIRAMTALREAARAQT